MARRRRKSDGSGETQMDLTPMIDVVFQLIIFFMIVTDMTSADYVSLTLPQARNAQKPDGSEKDFIVVNIQKEKEGGRNIFRIRGAKLPTYKDLAKVIEIEAAAARKPGQKLSDLKVIIRCDQDVEYKYVQDVFKACSMNKVWKVAVAADQPPEK